MEWTAGYIHSCHMIKMNNRIHKDYSRKWTDHVGIMGPDKIPRHENTGCAQSSIT
jgi:hypothetical protein